MGVLVLIGGLALAAQLAGVPPILVGAGVIVLAALAVLTALARSRRADPPASPPAPPAAN